jgi:hypothetical protein
MNKQDAVPVFGLDGTIDALSMQALLPAFASSPYELPAFPLSYCQPFDLAAPPSLDVWLCRLFFVNFIENHMTY